MESIKHALEVIAGVMRDGVAEHPDHECAHRSVDYHLAVPRSTCGCSAMAISAKDHVAQAATRLLMALML
jgi:hypothetical protein